MGDCWTKDLKSISIKKPCPKCGGALRYLTDKKINFCEEPFCTYSEKTCGNMLSAI